MRLIIMIFIMPLILNAAIDKDALNDYINRGNISSIIQMYGNAGNDEKEYIAMKMMEERGKFAVGQFQIFMQYMRNNAADMELVLKHCDSAPMDERVYPYLIEYFEMLYPDKLKEFVLRYQDSGLDYKKYSILFSKKGILPELTRQSKKGTQLRFIFSARMYALTDSTVYLNMLNEYKGDSIAVLVRDGLFSVSQSESIIKSKKTDLGALIDELVSLAVYNPLEDYTLQFKGTGLEYIYSEFRNGHVPQIGKDEKNRNIVYLAMAAALYNGDDEYYQNMHTEEMLNENTMNYLDCLYYLFTSDMESFRTTLANVLIREKSESARIKLVELLTLSTYSEDGTLYRMLVMEQYQQMRPILYLTAKDTPLNYYYLLKTGGNAENLKEILMGGAKTALHVCVIDYAEGLADKEFLKEFIKKYPESPINIFLRRIF